MSVGRQIHIRLPAEQAVRLELEAVKVGMSLPQYCLHLLSNQQSKLANKRQDEMYEMLKALHDNYFEVD